MHNIDEAPARYYYVNSDFGVTDSGESELEVVALKIIELWQLCSNLSRDLYI
jgi:hypothetical protein